MFTAFLFTNQVICYIQGSPQQFLALLHKPSWRSKVGLAVV